MLIKNVPEGMSRYGPYLVDPHTLLRRHHALPCVRSKGLCSYRRWIRGPRHHLRNALHHNGTLPHQKHHGGIWNGKSVKFLLMW